MRKVAFFAAVLSFSLLAGPVLAQTTAKPIPVSTLSPSQQYMIDLENYREDFKSYKITRSLYERELIAIAREFNRALEQAARDARTLGRSAESKANLAMARAVAAMIRDQAVAALGEPPIPPAKPQNSNKFKSQSPRPEKKN